MADNQQADSANTTPKYTLLESVDKLDELRYRVSFIMDAITQSSDWINDHAATGLYFTLLTMYDDIEDVSQSVYAELKAVRR